MIAAAFVKYFFLKKETVINILMNEISQGYALNCVIII